MTRKEAAKKIDELMMSGMDDKTMDALKTAYKSLTLWDDFIAKLADKCNSAVTPTEWQIHRKSIELIKKEFEEKIG